MPNPPKIYQPWNRKAAPKPTRAPDTRTTSRERGYDGKWEKLRNWWIRQHPVCQWPGCWRPAAIVDHVVPIDVAPERRLDETNLQSLCRSHHSVKTNEDKRRYNE